MPGICGIIDGQHEVDVSRRLPEMLDAMRYHDWYVEDCEIDASAGVGIGRVSLGFSDTGDQPVRCGELTAVFDGELYNADELAASLSADGAADPVADGPVALLLEGFQREGTAFLRRVNGSFVMAIWDRAEARLTLLNDRFGSRPLYYAHVDNRLLFASNIQALARDPDLVRTPYLRGAAQFFTYGYYLGDDTSLEQVKVLSAATVHSFEASSGTTLSRERYWHSSECTQQGFSKSDFLERTDRALKAAVDRRCGGEGLGLAISGGLDARTLLALMDWDRVSPTAICYTVPGSLDHRSSQEMARQAGCKYLHLALDGGFLDNFAEHMATVVRLTDGQYLSQCIMAPSLNMFREEGIQFLQRGHAGELMHMHKAYSYSVDREALQLTDSAAVEGWLFGHLQAYMLDGVDGSLFCKAGRDEVAEMSRDALHRCLEEVAAVDPPVERIWHMFLNQRLRRETALSLAKFGSVVEVRVPYLDNDLIELLLSAPPGWKVDAEIQAYILQKRRPSFLQIANANTGTHVGAGPLSRRFHTFKKRVFAKLNVPGYQPYERLGLWLRRELKPLVERTLLCDECLDGGLFDPNTLRGVVRQNNTNQRNHTFLIMALMLYELGHRRLNQAELASVS